MVELRKFEFFVLRYVPSVIRGEFVNIAVVMIESEGGLGFAEVRFTRSWDRVLRLDGQADIEVLEALKSEIEAQLAHDHSRRALIQFMEHSCSGVIGISERQAFLSNVPEIDIGELAANYLESPTIALKRVLSERERLVKRMAESFESAGVLNFVQRNVPMKPYTAPGDEFCFDFGYRTGNVLKLFQAVSFRPLSDKPQLLALRYPDMASAIERMTETKPFLTAVVDDHLDRSQLPVQFALNMLKDRRIRLASLGEMDEIAAVARQEIPDSHASRL